MLYEKVRLLTSRKKHAKCSAIDQSTLFSFLLPWVAVQTANEFSPHAAAPAFYFFFFFFFFSSSKHLPKFIFGEDLDPKLFGFVEL